MKYYIAGDGGGTKLQVILYDENLHIVNSVRMSGTNTIQRTTEDVLEDMNRLIEELIPEGIQEIESIDLSILRFEKEFRELLQKHYTVHHYTSWNEGAIPLLSAGVSYGIVAQAGTGSDAFLIQPNGNKFMGGWGFVLGDEGSGYDIGRQALKACMLYGEERGPRTLIFDILKEEWGINRSWDIVGKVYDNKNYHNLIASVAKMVSKAAAKNDPVALQIYENAGHALAEVVLDAITWNKGVWEGPIIASGGAWKGSPVMFETFCKEIHEKYPEAGIRFPVFEPVVGCAIGRWFADGHAFAEFEEQIRREFAEFMYH